MNWINTKENTPITYKTGDFDGKNSDPVLVVDNDCKISIAYLCEGFMDGSEFSDWYDEKEYLLDKIPIYWMPLPNAPF